MELFRKAIKGNENELVEDIEVEGTGLWRQLKDRNILTEDQIEICQKKV